MREDQTYLNKTIIIFGQFPQIVSGCVTTYRQNGKCDKKKLIDFRKTCLN